MPCIVNTVERYCVLQPKVRISHAALLQLLTIQVIPSTIFFTEVTDFMQALRFALVFAACDKFDTAFTVVSLASNGAAYF